MATRTVRATETGFDGRIRQPGDVFEIDDAVVQGTWFEPVEDDTPAAKAPRKTAKNPALRGDEKEVGPDGKPASDDPLN